MHTFGSLGRLLGEPKWCSGVVLCDARLPSCKSTVSRRPGDAKFAILRSPGDPPRRLPLTIFRLFLDILVSERFTMAAGPFESAFLTLPFTQMHLLSCPKSWFRRHFFPCNHLRCNAQRLSAETFHASGDTVCLFVVCLFVWLFASYMFCKMHSAVPAGVLVRIYLLVNLCARLSVCFSGWPSVCLHTWLPICVLDYVSAPRSARLFVGQSASVVVYSDYVIVCMSAWSSSCVCARQAVF